MTTSVRDSEMIAEIMRFTSYRELETKKLLCLEPSGFIRYATLDLLLTSIPTQSELIGLPFFVRIFVVNRLSNTHNHGASTPSRYQNSVGDGRMRTPLQNGHP